jgi:hypothetical protein
MNKDNHIKFYQNHKKLIVTGLGSYADGCLSIIFTLKLIRG